MWTTLCRALVVAASVLAAAPPPLLPAAADTARQCSQADRGDIALLFDRWRAALAAGDLDAIVGFYASDAVLVAAGSQAPHTGQAAIRAYFAELAGRHPTPTVSMRAVTVGCDMATETGSATVRITGLRKGTRMLIGGRFATTLAMREGRWLITRQSLQFAPRSIGQDPP